MTELLFDLRQAIDALTLPRAIHTTFENEHGAFAGICTIEHPPLIDLLENGLGVAGRGTSAGRSSGRPSPIDAGALETWAQIRDQVRSWLRQLKAPWTDDLKHDLRTWQIHHENAVRRGRVSTINEQDVLRLVRGWQRRIETKYDPDERREWTEPCPAVLRLDGDKTARCNARRIMRDGVLQYAIALNVSRLEAECRQCGTRWEGRRGLMQLRYETNLWDQLDADLEAAAAVERRELTSTGPIDIP